jgi:hypothetical protein
MSYYSSMDKIIELVSVLSRDDENERPLALGLESLMKKNEFQLMMNNTAEVEYKNLYSMSKHGVSFVSTLFMMITL